MSIYQPLTFHYDELDSTNDEAVRLLLSNPPPFFVTASKQSAGRGRMGRRWHSPEGNLYLTAVFMAGIVLKDLPLFTLYASLKVCHRLSELTKVEFWLKWPNDIWVGEKKCAGFLAESPVAPNYGRLILLGMGLNVNTVSFPKELESIATSLRQETEREFSVRELGGLLGNEIVEAYDNFFRRAYEDELATLWKRYDRLQGQQIRYEENGVVQKGVVMGLAPDGSLKVETNRIVRSLRSGEITLSKHLRGRKFAK